MRTEAAMAVMQPEASESREPQKLGGARTGDRRAGSLLTPCLRISGSQNCE